MLTNLNLILTFILTETLSFSAEKIDFLATYLSKERDNDHGKLTWLTCLMSGLSASSMRELVIIDYKKPMFESLQKGLLIRRFMEAMVNQLRDTISAYDQDVLFYKRRQMILGGGDDCVQDERKVQNFCALKYSR